MTSARTPSLPLGSVAQRASQLGKDIENGELRRAADSQVAPYDATWMWREPGLEDER